MADSLSSPQSLNLNPAKPESNSPPFQPESARQPITSAPTKPSPALNPNPISNPPTVPSIPTPAPLYGRPAVSGAPLFRPAPPQFTPISGAVNYNNPSVSSGPVMANPAAPRSVMPYQVQVTAPVPVPVPRQPPNPALRPYMQVPNGYSAMPPPGGLFHLSSIALTRFLLISFSLLMIIL